MKRRKRIIYSAAQRALMWDRYQQGESLADIARLFDRFYSSIERHIAATGGIRPPERKRPAHCLSLEEREEISRGLVTSESIRSIATRLARSPSTISREINRNGGYHGYRASDADKAAWERARRPKPCKLRRNKQLSRIVARKLKAQWSPQQISGWLKKYLLVRVLLRVTRNDLQNAVYTSTRGFEERACSMLANTTR